MTTSANAPVNKDNIRKKAVWYGGTDVVAKGTPLYYSDASGNVVRKEADLVAPFDSPIRFAGTALQEFKAGGANGRLVEVAEPGSHGAPVLLGATLTAGASIGHQTGTGKFVAGTADGRGTGYANEAGDDGDVVSGHLIDGPYSAPEA